MKTFVLLVLTVIALFLWQRGDERNVKTSPNANVAPAAPAVTQQTAQHDWAKRSIDRAREVVADANSAQRQNQQP
jgi:hypothetical protein